MDSLRDPALASLLDRLPWWGPAIPAALWLAAVAPIWWRRRRPDEGAR